VFCDSGWPGLWGAQSGMLKAETVSDVRYLCRPDCEECTDSDMPGPEQLGSTYFKMLTARAMTSATVITEIADCVSMVSFVQRVRGITSVGLNAIAFVNDTYR
jgi:hypothetical protein